MSAIEVALDNYITAARNEELAIERAMIRLIEATAIARFQSSRDLFGSDDKPPTLVATATWAAVFAVGYAGPLKLRFSECAEHANCG